MDNIYRLKIKVGPNEFEAEGDREAVQEQFNSWKELIAIMAHAAQAQPQNDAPSPDFQPPPPPPKTDLASTDYSLDKIMKTDDRIVSMTVRPKSLEDGILLMLYGQKILRIQESVTGYEILEGLKATGVLSVGRIDRMLERAASDGQVIVTGKNRAKRYRLTNAGLAKARQIASDLIAIVA